jgi:hypothetical protein
MGKKLKSYLKPGFKGMGKYSENRCIFLCLLLLAGNEWQAV